MKEKIFPEVKKVDPRKLYRIYLKNQIDLIKYNEKID